jgi:PA14 domain
MSKRKNYWHGIQGVLGLTALVISLAACGTPAPTAIPSDPNPLTAQTAVSGLTGQYFDNADFTGASQTRVDTSISFNWGSTAPITGIQPTGYSVRWTGQIVPEFNEEYTFYVTSSDGARLMVNGKVLVNNWTDHASTVNSDKITLKAGVKYDLRLEYYRNATNPGAVKLEWSSLSRARAVVPASALLSTGSNASLAMAVLSADPDFMRLNVQPNQADAFASVSAAGSFLVAREGTTKNLLAANIVGNSITHIFRYTQVGSDLQVYELKQKTIPVPVTLGSLTTLTGVLTDQQRTDLGIKLFPLVSKREIQAPVAGLQPASFGGTLRPKVIEFLFNNAYFMSAFPPPSACASCQDLADNYRKTIGRMVAGVVELGISAAGFAIPSSAVGLTTAFNWIVGGTPSLFGLIDFGYGFLDYAPDRDAYMQCIAGTYKDYPTDTQPRPGCKPVLDPEPQAIVVNAAIGSSGSKPITFGAKNIVSGSLFGSYTYVGAFGAGIGSYTNNPGSGSIGLRPGESMSVTLAYQCPAVPKVISGTFTVTSNATKPSVSSSVKIDCGIKTAITVSSIYYDSYFKNFVVWSGNINGVYGSSKTGITGFKTQDEAFAWFKADSTTRFATNNPILTFDLIPSSSTAGVSYAYVSRLN